MAIPSLPRLLLVPVAFAAAVFSGPAHSADVVPKAQPIVKKQLSPKCLAGVDGKVVDQPSNTSIPHQYMLLLVFKKGKGTQYFGEATGDQYGCIPDVENKVDSKTGASVLTPTGTQMIGANCPNDCVYPRESITAMENGSDPLGANPWGVLSATDPTSMSGAKDSKIEIWGLAAVDACHARKLYEYHTATGKNRRFANALKRGHLLGEIMVGYRDPAHKQGPSTVCQ